MDLRSGVGLGSRSRVRQSWRMKHFPFPVRVAAGLAASTADTVRDLPKHLTELPVTVASQVLQTSMRVQQHVTELAIKGDDALAAFHGAEDEPNWATFDEDDDPTAARADAWTESDAPGAAATFDDPWDAESQALGEEHADGEFDSTETGIAATGTVTSTGTGGGTGGTTDDGANGTESEPAPGTIPSTTGSGPAGVTDYDALSLPELRSRLRSFSADELEQLLDHERDNENRPSFTGMLTRRIANVRAESDTGSSDTGPSDTGSDAVPDSEPTGESGATATGETTTS
ncbi:lipid droplet-associated protein [Prauserella halophila]|uniref:Lipid droplet-associated protein n=2 Tax=Prauserella halophila TaxID=185641 RepID=A0ABP4GUD9_9PSEU|nr:hypothetical protein [Prauserella halophila]